MPLFKNSTFFSKQLLIWHSTNNKRQMPWKGEKDPYKIWLSEVILQQTRVEQGLSYYLKFIQKYPTVIALAIAKDETVFKLWEGLGYYSRCKNLLAAARLIAFEKNGIFPNTHQEISALKGVGPYTAAAISSFAFNLPHAVVDGNVYRILARFFGIDTPIDSLTGKKEFAQLAQQLLNKANPSLHNQAIMDFGATICKPKQPLCNTCPLQKKCVSRLENTVHLLPIKEKKLSKQIRYFHFLIIKFNNQVYFEQRTDKDIWQSLWQPFLIETVKPLLAKDAIKMAVKNKIFTSVPKIIDSTQIIKQQLTHQTIIGVATVVETANPLQSKKLHLFTKNSLQKLAMPKLVKQLIEG
jgi:A/G-specific adenine glycosylase